MNFDKLSQFYQEEYLDKLSRILEIPSVYQESEQFPYGEAIQEALTAFLQIGEADGFDVKNVDGHAGHIEFGEGEELIGILGHLDVVPAGEGWSYSPFTPTIVNGKLYARGAQDDKGPVMAAYIAMKLLKDQGFKPKKRVRLIAGTDEERDWKGMDYYFKHEEMPGFGFSPDASFPVIHAEKGLMDFYFQFDLSREEGYSDVMVLEALTSGDRLNMVPDQADASIRTNEDIEESFQQFIRSSKADGEIHRVGDQVQIHVEGKAVHASNPQQGINALSELLRYLMSLPIDQSQLIGFLFDSFSDSTGGQIGLSMKDDVSGPLTLNLGFLQFKRNEQCKAGINLRYPVTAKPEIILDTLKELHAPLAYTFKLYDHLEALYIEKEHPFLQTLTRVYNEAMGTHEQPISIGGATYARSLSTGVAFGAMFSDSPDTAHQKDEHVRISDMVKAIAIYAASIYELTN
ncbi:dipeptidase PepV [Halobacillus rhizosphaerae]|uniref:dipeptidase PepV n=1 Tax=Halobacillus rhizosphaerae TaxID=3064889 RepID=UPI00398B0238